MRNPETPGIYPDTPDIPDLNPDIPVLQSYERRVVWLVVFVIGYGLFQSFKLYCIHSHIICIRIDAAAEGVIYEVVAEPQEPQGQAPQQEDRGEQTQGSSHPSVEQQTQGKPRCTSFYFKL